MKYNVFARPMFKRGGISRGTGITSGLDTPRRNFQYGTGYPGNPINSPERFPGESDIYKKMKEPPIGGDSSIIEKATKAVGPTSDYKDALLDYWPYKEGDKFGNYDFWPTVPPGTRLDEQGRIIQEEEYVSPARPHEDMPALEGIEAEGKKDFGPYTEGSALEGKATKSEEDILLEQLGDTSLSKGEKALMLSEIIGQKGWKGKTDKALELMKAKSKEDRQLKKDIAKLKYLQKGKEKIAGISAGALGSTEKTIEAAISARKAGAESVVTGKDGVKYYDGKSEDQIRNEIYKLQTAKEDIGEKLGGQILVRSKDEILGLKQKIAELEGKEKLSTTQQKQLDKKKKALEFYKKMPGYDLLYKEGGRVGYAQGTPMAEPQVAATQVEGANTTENTRPVNKLSFAELRNRLPKEITDDVVQLLAASEEALQDFAYIQTQEDINKFNVKYGVNVILPPQA